MPSNTNDINEKYVKLKRFIIVGVLVILAVLGWHIYENYIHVKPAGEDETQQEHEIVDLTQKLFTEELNTYNSPVIRVNLQGKTKSYSRDDHAAKPLLELNNDLLATDASSTITLMMRLFDNYELDSQIVEMVTPAEEQEEMDFLNAILNTAIMKRTMKFLHQKGIISTDHRSQLKLLKDIWFTQYSRGHGRIGSSGFEHIFLAELKDHQILGLHNWIYFNQQEKQGHLNYMGYIDSENLGKNNHYLLATRFTFHNIVKPYNTLFIGTSPELEMSLYTVCFLLSVGKPCPVQLGATKFNIITHEWNWKGKKTLATGYPSIEE